MDRVCVVVGVGKGIGLSVAQRFAREGFKMGLIARSEEKLANFSSSLELDGNKAVGIATDVTRNGQLTAAIREIERRLGPIGVLVYNAVASVEGLPSDLRTTDLRDTLETNVVAALTAAQLVIPGMRTRGRGTLLFTGGGLALRPSAQFAALSVGKAALRSLVGAFSAELYPDGVHVATVTVAGRVARGTPFDPDLIAEKFWQLHTQPKEQWQAEIVFDGNGG